MKVTTLCFYVRENKILLGLKKRGFGEGRWNGFGGKLNPGEMPYNAMLREMHEESGLTPTKLTSAGILTFNFSNGIESIEVHVFTTANCTGTLIETEEMKPEWFTFDQIPYDKMWPDDILWLPHILHGKTIDGVFYFKDMNVIESYDLEID